MTTPARCLSVALALLLGCGAARLGSAPGASFARFDEGLPRSGQWRDGFAIADADGDGHADLVHGPARKGRRQPVVFLGDGHGRWRAWDAARFPPLAYEYGDAAVGDVTGDGVADVALAMHLRGAAVLAGSRDGTFRDLGRSSDALRGGSRALALVDWNRDGRLDLAVAGEGAGPAPGMVQAAGLRLFLGRDGAWVPLAASPDARGPASTAVAVGDVDGDGRPDAVTGSSELGRQDLLYAGTSRGGVDRLPIAALPPRSLVQDVALADLDGDGRDELVAALLTREEAGWRARVDVVTSPRDPNATARTLVARESREGFAAIATGDLDADGARDVVVVEPEGGLLPLFGDGRGGFARGTAVDAPFPGCAGRRAVLADLDGMPGDEIVVSYADEDAGCASGGGIAAWKCN